MQYRGLEHGSSEGDRGNVCEECCRCWPEPIRCQHGIDGRDVEVGGEELWLCHDCIERLACPDCERLVELGLYGLCQECADQRYQDSLCDGCGEPDRPLSYGVCPECTNREGGN